MIKLIFSMFTNPARLMLLCFMRTFCLPITHLFVLPLLSLIKSDARLLKNLGNFELLVQFCDYLGISRKKQNLRTVRILGRTGRPLVRVVTRIGSLHHNNTVNPRISPPRISPHPRATNC